MTTEVLSPNQPVTINTELTPQIAPWEVDVSRGSTNNVLHKQWAHRPDDQRYMDLDTMYAALKARSDSSFTEDVPVSKMRLGTGSELSIITPRGVELDLTHWGMTQVCQAAGAPASYIRSLPAQLAAANLHHGLQNSSSTDRKIYYHQQDGLATLRALTSESYGRIYDHQVVKAVQSIAGNGTGDSRWKVPGQLNWANRTYDPNTPITKESTTLYASDRDVWLFLVDDRNPVSIGKLPSGNDDLVFRGFYVYNSEVGSRKFGLATFWFRGVCANRNLWGIEEHNELSFRHSSGAPLRFMSKARPVLDRYAESKSSTVTDQVQAARAIKIGSNDTERIDWLMKQDITKPVAQKVLHHTVAEEERHCDTLWDAINGLTAYARTVTFQDDRHDLERTAAKLMKKVKLAAA